MSEEQNTSAGEPSLESVNPDALAWNPTESNSDPVADTSSADKPISEISNDESQVNNDTASGDDQIASQSMGTGAVDQATSEEESQTQEDAKSEADSNDADSGSKLENAIVPVNENAFTDVKEESTSESSTQSKNKAKKKSSQGKSKTKEPSSKQATSNDDKVPQTEVDKQLLTADPFDQFNHDLNAAVQKGDIELPKLPTAQSFEETDTPIVPPDADEIAIVEGYDTSDNVDEEGNPYVAWEHRDVSEAELKQMIQTARDQKISDDDEDGEFVYITRKIHSVEPWFLTIEQETKPKSLINLNQFEV